MIGGQSARGTAGFEVRSSRVLGGFDVAEVVYAPRFAMGFHQHPQPYLTAVLAGSYEERVAGGWRACRDGTVVFRPAAELHATRFQDAGARCLRVRLASQWLHRVLAGARAPATSVALEPARAGWLAARLHLELRAGDGASRIAMEGAVLGLVAEMLRWPALDEDRTPGWLPRVVERIETGFRERLTLAGLAEEAAVHPAHLARVFRRVRGMTVADYVRRLRLSWAMIELRASGRPLAAVAHDAGYADQSHFTRALKAATGWTPRAFRERSRPS